MTGRDLKYWDFEVGQVLIHRWTLCYSQYQAQVKIVKVNPKSVGIELLTAPEGYEIGRRWTVKTSIEHQTVNNGLFEIKGG